MAWTASSSCCLRRRVRGYCRLLKCLSSQSLSVVGGGEEVRRNAGLVEGSGEVLNRFLVALICKLPSAEMAGDGLLGL